MTTESYLANSMGISTETPAAPVAPTNNGSTVLDASTDATSSELEQARPTMPVPMQRAGAFFRGMGSNPRAMAAIGGGALFTAAIGGILAHNKTKNQAAKNQQNMAAYLANFGPAPGYTYGTPVQSPMGAPEVRTIPAPQATIPQPVPVQQVQQAPVQQAPVVSPAPQQSAPTPPPAPASAPTTPASETTQPVVPPQAPPQTDPQVQQAAPVHQDPVQSAAQTNPMPDTMSITFLKFDPGVPVDQIAPVVAGIEDALNSGKTMHDIVKDHKKAKKLFEGVDLAFTFQESRKPTFEDMVKRATAIHKVHKLWIGGFTDAVVNELYMLNRTVNKYELTTSQAAF